MTPQEKHLREMQRALQKARELYARIIEQRERSRRVNLKAARNGD